MRRHKRDRGKPIPVSDLQAVAKFRAELEVYAKLKREGMTHVEATRAVFADDLAPPSDRKTNASDE